MRRSTRIGGPRRRLRTHCVVPALTVPAVLDRSSGAWTAIALIVPSFVLSRGVAGRSGVHRIVRIRVRRALAIFPRPFGSPENVSPQGPSAIGGPIRVRWRIADIIRTRRPFPALAAVAVAVALRSRCWAATAGIWTLPAGSSGHPLMCSAGFGFRFPNGRSSTLGDDSDSDDEDEDAEQELEPSATTSAKPKVRNRAPSSSRLTMGIRDKHSGGFASVACSEKDGQSSSQEGRLRSS